MENSGPPHPCQQGRWKLPSAFRGWRLEVGAGIRCGCLVTLAAPHPIGSLMPRAPSNHPPSFTMPTARHFWKRQNWQRFRRLLSTGQSLFARQMYLALFCTVRWRGGNTEQAVRAWGGGLGEGTVPILLPTQTKAPSVHSYFPNIWVQGREKWRSRGGREVWDTLGEDSASKERSQNPRLC